MFCVPMPRTAQHAQHTQHQSSRSLFRHAAADQPCALAAHFLYPLLVAQALAAAAMNAAAQQLVEARKQKRFEPGRTLLLGLGGIPDDVPLFKLQSIAPTAGLPHAAAATWSAVEEKAEPKEEKAACCTLPSHLLGWLTVWVASS